MSESKMMTRGYMFAVLDAAAAGFVFKFPAVILAWHDGDTPIVDVRLSPTIELHAQHVRVQGINAPELHSEGGSDARSYAMQLAPPGAAVTLTSRSPDKYGRLLATVTLADGRDFGALMIDAGHAVAYMV